MDYTQELREASHEYYRKCNPPLEFQRARIEASLTNDARCLGEYLEWVRRLVPGWVTPMETMHLDYAYNE